MRTGLSVVLAAGISILSSTSGLASDNTISIEWETKTYKDNPLVGQVWSVEDQKIVPEEELNSVLRTAEILAFGERHDNPDHHRIQGWLTTLTGMDRVGIPVAMEMLNTDQQQALDRYLEIGNPTVEGIGAAVDWEKSGWPAWKAYQPIGEAIFTTKSRLYAASLPRSVYRPIMKNGAKNVLGQEQYNQLNLTWNFPDDIQDQRLEEIRASHCNMLPETMVAPMLNIQTIKDAYMARTLVDLAKHSPSGKAILIAGNGHTRKDYGVPAHVRKMAPEKDVLSVGILEVQKDKADPKEYGSAFDIIIFTPRLDDKDPCAVYADQLKKIKKP